MIKKTYLIEKRNLLNEIRTNNMTLQELRFFSIYLARINSRDINSRKVRFSLSDFQKIMDMGRLNIKYMKTVTDGLLCKVVSLVKPNGGYTSFQLFKECEVNEDEHGNWYVEIDAHDKALPLMFEFKEKYFTYHLWNALKLKSSNQLRMYEILKQYERIGERTISMDELRALLGIEEKEYARWERFKTRVLDSCQKALAENTDIKYTYEPTGKRGHGGKVLTLKFKIFKNDDYIDKLTLSKFLNSNEPNGLELDESIYIDTEQVIANENIDEKEEDRVDELFDLEFYREACNNEFSREQLQVLYNLVIKILPFSNKNQMQLDIYDYLKRKYDELNYRASIGKITSRFGYIKKIISIDLE